MALRMRMAWLSLELKGMRRVAGKWRWGSLSGCGWWSGRSLSTAACCEDPWCRGCSAPSQCAGASRSGQCCDAGRLPFMGTCCLWEGQALRLDWTCTGIAAPG